MRRSYQGLAVAVETRPHDTQDTDDEQDGEGHALSPACGACG